MSPTMPAHVVQMQACERDEEFVRLTTILTLTVSLSFKADVP